MRLVLVQTGRLRDPAIAGLVAEYVKRFRRFGALSVIEREPKGDTPLWPVSARWKVALDERGRTWDSPAFARQVQDWTMRHGEVAFMVGAAYGHHAPSLALADAHWSLSPLVLPHQLAHLVVAEQCYRAATILAGTGYHHA